MANSQLDSLDYKILQMLSVNARKPYLEIARECNVSGAAIHQRIQKLINTGVLIGSESLVNPSAVGYETCAYVGFFLKDPSAFRPGRSSVERDSRSRGMPLHNRSIRHVHKVVCQEQPPSARNHPRQVAEPRIGAH